jgi:hypothetical protein
MVGFENRVLRKKFGPKREKITRGWRRFNNELFTVFARV